MTKCLTELLNLSEIVFRLFSMVIQSTLRSTRSLGLVWLGQTTERCAGFAFQSIRLFPEYSLTFGGMFLIPLHLGQSI